MALCYENNTKVWEKFTQDLILQYMNKDDLFMVNHISALHWILIKVFVLVAVQKNLINILFYVHFLQQEFSREIALIDEQKMNFLF